MPNTQRRISLWSSPRNISTALMYSFAQRPDTRVWDEPLYGYYLKHTGAPHPGADEVIAAMDCDGERVVESVILGACDRPLMFFKNMTHHLVGLDLDFLTQTINVLLTRDPEQMVPSLAQALGEPGIRDTGFPQQLELIEQLENLGQTPVVLESRELLLNPAAVLTQLCEQVDIPFDRCMLRWETGPKPYDGMWAPHWYANVHRSTGFAPYQPKTDPVPDNLRPLIDACQPYYAELLERAIRAPTDEQEST
ncbi:MAG: sulfotransferase family protein [Gammaproteobacteria bacterium]|nr:MAG: sulfotransferase family protein [Gammaproteobacteria bacterium]